jgi:hypothetical protein
MAAAATVSSEHTHHTHHTHDTTFCTYCAHSITRMEKALTHKPWLRKKIAHTKTIMNNHNTRDKDTNELTCPMLKAYRCFKCGEFGHTPSRCTPCEYCEQRGHNERECPKKRAHEKHMFTTIVLKITKKVGFEDTLDKLKDFCEEHGVDIVKEI